jgi:pyruvate,water dikinase
VAVNELCANRHAGLHQVHERLSEDLRLTLAGREDREGPLIFTLDEIRPRNWALVGGKAAHLAVMRHDPLLRVPDGFVITARAYNDLIDCNGLRPQLLAFEQRMAESAPVALEELRQALESAVLAATPPPGLLEALAQAVRNLPQTDTPLFLAVRSSAQEEDMDFSFAGQFRSVLNVPAQPEALFAAAREVMASLFSAGAVAYRRRVFPDEGKMAIAVVCQRMVDSRSSGIVFSVDTMQLAHDTMVVVAAWGQGEAVVEGGTPTDTFQLRKGPPISIAARQVADKEQGLFAGTESGLTSRAIAEELRTQPCLSDEELLQLGSTALHLESLFKRPQDVEWAIESGTGQLFVLQARPLVLNTLARDKAQPVRLEQHEVICAEQGRVAQQGIAAGPVHIVNFAEETTGEFPEGAVLVTHRDSSRLITLIQRASAVITETGTPVSHMATICREFQVPCLVNVGKFLGKVREGELITVDAEDRRIYRGIVEGLLVYRATSCINLMSNREFRLLRRILKKVSELHLVDPMMQDFSIAGCRTYHDILRFAHESAVQEMVNLGRDERRLLQGSIVRPMKLPIPTGILVIDIGGGLAADAPERDVPYQAIASVPFRAVLQGMLFPEIWHNNPMPVGFRDMMSSMFSPVREEAAEQYSGHNIAIIGSNYVNLCFRLGYHYNIIDAHCGEAEQNNHLYYRFLGGVTDMTKRSRRAAMIAIILKEFEFNVQIKGDLVTARLSRLPQQEAQRALDILGRLVGYTRQLDVCMESDADAEKYAEAFLNGEYRLG